MAFPTGWGRKCAITIDNTKVIGSGSHSNFPALITVDNVPAEAIDAGGNSALNGGGDIRFSSDSAGTTQLACEIVSYVTNASAGSRECEIWVDIPSLSTSTDTTIYMWYNKAGETQPAVTGTYGRNAVWSDYKLASHDGITDSSGNVTITNNGTSAATGPFGTASGARDFDGVDDYLSYSQTPTRPRVLSCWFNPDVLNVEQTLGHNYSFLRFAGIGLNTSGELRTEEWSSGAIREAAAGTSPSVGTWSLAHGKHLDGTGVDCYHNAAGALSPDTANREEPGSSWRWGEGTYSTASISGNFDGKMAELRVRNGDLPGDWITTEYNNQFSPSTFATAGTPEAVGGGGDITIDLSSFPAAETAVIDVGPNVIKGSISLSLTTQATADALLGAVGLGSISLDLTSTPASGTTAALLDAALLGSISLDLASQFAASTGTALIEDTVLGSISLNLSGNVSSSTSSATIDQIVLSSLSIEPGTSASTSDATNPEVGTGGNVSVSPAVVGGTSAAAIEDILYGSLTIGLSSFPAQTTSVSGGHTVVQGSLSLTSGEASTTTTALIDDVILGGLSIDLSGSPSLASSDALINDVIFGSISINTSTDIASVTSTGENPTIDISGATSVNVSPDEGITTSDALIENVIYGSVTTEPAVAASTSSAVFGEVFFGSITIDLISIAEASSDAILGGLGFSSMSVEPSAAVANTTSLIAKVDDGTVSEERGRGRSMLSMVNRRR